MAIRTYLRYCECAVLLTKTLTIAKEAGGNNMKTYFSKLSVGVFFKCSKGNIFVRVGAIDDDNVTYTVRAGSFGNSHVMNAVHLEEVDGFPPGCLMYFEPEEYVEIITNPLLGVTHEPTTDRRYILT